MPRQQYEFSKHRGRPPGEIAPQNELAFARPRPGSTAVTYSGTLNQRFARLTILNIFAGITVPLTGLVDTAMLGHLEDLRWLAGMSLATVVFTYLYWSFSFLRMGATGTTAGAVGAGNEQEIWLVLYRFALTALTLGLFMLLLRGPVGDVAFALMSGTPEVKAAGREYYDARIWGAPAALANMALTGWLLGREKARAVLVITVIGNLANVFLNYVFIMRLDLAAAGAGYASMAGQYIALGTGLLILMRENFPSVDAGEIIRGKALVSMFRLNRDIMIRTLCLISVFALFTNYGAKLGTRVLSANTVLQQIFLLAAFLIDGAALALESLAGNLHARGEKRALRRVILLGLAVGVASAAIFVTVFLAVPGLFRLLTSHGDVIALARLYAPWLVPAMLIGSVAFVLDGLFLGLTRGKALRDALIFATLGFFLFALPAVFVWRDNHLLWLALTVFLTIRAVYLGLHARGFISPPRFIAPGPGNEQ